MYIPKGQYLTLEQYRMHIGGVTRATILKAIRDDRLKGAIQITDRLIIIPQDAILFNKSIKTGKHIGVNAWIRGEIEHQEEVEGWERKQAQLRQMRKGDKKDPDEEHDYN